MGKILHIGGYDKFTKPLLEKLVPRHTLNTHVLFLCRRPDFDISSDLCFVRPNAYNFIFKFFMATASAERIILHGLFETRLIAALAIFPWLLNKTTLIAWGGDIYDLPGKLNIWSRLLFKLVLRNIDCIATTVPGDFEYVRNTYSTKARYIQSLMYYSHLARVNCHSANPNKDDAVVVQIGNSADPLNNHIEIMSRLPEDTHVFAPLAYGDVQYRDRVIEVGGSRFGARFDAMTQFMSFDKYTERLSRVSVAVFNQPRQAAMGNCIAYLSLGKKLYIRSDTTPWGYFRSLGFYVFDTLGELDLTPLSPVEAEHNMQLARIVFSEEALLKSWDTLANQECSG